jgi:hypothetical protein
MDTANTENLLVVKKPDGTLAARQVSSLPPDQQDTSRTYATDLELNRLMCDCGNDMKPFLVKSSLAKGYSVEDLVDSGVPISNLLAGDAPVADLLDAGVGPMDLYNNGVPLDSIYGKYCQGGLIFYLDVVDIISGVQAIVAAPSDLGTFHSWGCSGVAVGVQDTAIGSGKTNTSSIVAADCSTSNDAARACYHLSLNDYSDWFLPSKHELNTLYQRSQLGSVPFGNYDTSRRYWTSTEGPLPEQPNAAWTQYFTHCGQFTASKIGEINVVPVRYVYD